MKTDYGTYSHKWLIVGPFAGTAMLGGELVFLPMPMWGLGHPRSAGGWSGYTSARKAK